MFGFVFVLVLGLVLEFEFDVELGFVFGFVLDVKEENRRTSLVQGRDDNGGEIKSFQKASTWQPRVRCLFMFGEIWTASFRGGKAGMRAISSLSRTSTSL